MGIFSTKNKFKMDALRIKERGSKDTPTNFAESAVEFMKGMPGYYPQDHEPGHPNEREERRPDISSITEDDIINKKVVKKDGGEYITGQVKVDGGARPDSGGSYEKVYDKFETNEMGQKVNPTTGATYNSVEEFIKDAKESDRKEGYGEQIYDVDRKIDYAKSWKSDFWTWGFKPDVVQQRHDEDPNYISPVGKLVMAQLKDRAIRDEKGVRRGDRLTTLYRSLVKADMLKKDDHNWNELGAEESTKILTRIYDELILKDPEKAKEIYLAMKMRTTRNTGRTTRTGSSGGSDTGYRYTSD